MVVLVLCGCACDRSEPVLFRRGGPRELRGGDTGSVLSSRRGPRRCGRDSGLVVGGERGWPHGFSCGFSARCGPGRGIYGSPTKLSKRLV